MQIIDRKTVAIPGPVGDVTPEALAALAQTETYRDESVQARDAAVDARNEAEIFAAGTSALQDAAIASQIGDPESESRDALAAVITEITVPVDDGENLMTALDQKRAAVLSILGDSVSYKNGSGNYVGTDGHEWPRQISSDLATEYPTCRVGYQLLSSGAPVTWGAEQVLQYGEGSASVFSDTFDRTAADLVGTSPNLGGAWAGTASEFSLPGDGTATRTAGSTVKNAATTAAARMDTTFDVTFDAAASGTVTCMGSRVNATTYLMLRINPAADTVEAITVYTNTVTVRRTFTFAEAGIAASGTVNVTLRINHKPGSQVEFTVGSASYTYALTGPEEAAYAAAVGVGIGATSVGAKFRTVSAMAPTPAQGSLHVWNGAMGSRDAQWSAANLAALLPEKPDAVIIAHSHNHEAETPAQFEAALDALVAAIWTLHGDAVGVLIAGQNPQYPPTANPAEHNARQAALRRYARVRGFGYIPVFEVFMAESFPQSLVLSDGVHPTTAGIDLVGSTVSNHLASLSARPTA